MHRKSVKNKEFAKGRKALWLANAIDCQDDDACSKSERRLVLDPMTGKPAAGPAAALMALCLAETLPCNG